ncbi:hypothetical protein [Staphylococcus epidermidis]|nr:hypothetical protein [Staphylococcus epidermidis]EJE18442.1 hypothetical protein HMPREF9978_02471 [Staphylococcus epidermidis NIHLM015]
MNIIILVALKLLKVTGYVKDNQSIMNLQLKYLKLSNRLSVVV